MQILKSKRSKWIIAGIATCCIIAIAATILMKLGRVEISPRPIPNQTLLDDAALARNAWLPDVNKSWQQDVMTRHAPIRSLFSDDFSDFQFLKPLLEDKRIVMLGENSHGVAEYSWMKARLIRFLHQEMAFDVLAFEGSMTGAYYLDKEIDKIDAVSAQRNAVFGTWQTEEVKQVFDHLKTTRQQGHPLTLAGFDIQNSSSTYASTSAASLFKRVLEQVKSPLAGQVDEIEKKLSEVKFDAPSIEVLTEVSSFYREVSDALTTHRSLPEKKVAQEPLLLQLAAQEAQSRIQLTEFLRLFKLDPKGSNDMRDAAMAANLNFLLDKMYPNRKVIVWAHNAHIGVGYPYQSISKSMGAWIAETRKAETYSIGLFMGRGGQVMNAWTRQVLPFLALEDNSLEAIMASANRKMSYVDFSQVRPAAGNEWIFSPLGAKDWGKTPIKFIPSNVFDAVLYIDDVTPPKYLAYP
jgi:erythromycin esterase